ncbi:MAG: hypothetical protein PHZ09_10675 [Eubacteriales bacterium]|jgi:hypothetical protein|nr:hypothetical protein [Eubacteriales bacterium]
MLYVLYRYNFGYPNPGTARFTFDSFDSKKDFFDYLIEIYEISVSITRGFMGDAAAKKAGRVLNALIAIYEDKDIESKPLAGLEWIWDSFYLKICFAEYFPKVLEGFRESVLEVAGGMFDKYAGLDAAGKKAYEDDELFELYEAFEKIDANLPRRQFGELFIMLMDNLDDEELY